MRCPSLRFYRLAALAAPAFSILPLPPLAANQCSVTWLPGRIAAESTYLPLELQGISEYIPPPAGEVPLKYKIESWSGAAAIVGNYVGGCFFDYELSYEGTLSFVFDEASGDFIVDDDKVVHRTGVYCPDNNAAATFGPAHLYMFGGLSDLIPPGNQVAATTRSFSESQSKPPIPGTGVYIWYSGDLTESLSEEFTVADAMMTAERNTTVGSERLSFANDFELDTTVPYRTAPVRFHAQRVRFQAVFEGASACAAPGRHPVRYRYYRWEIGSPKPDAPNYVEYGDVEFVEGQPRVAPSPTTWKEAPNEVGWNYEIAVAEMLSSCEGGSPGAGGGGLGSVEHWFALGRDHGGRSAGVLALNAPHVTAALYAPAALQLASIDSPEVVTIRDANEVLLQVKAPECLADIAVIDSYSYEIRFFAPGQIGTQDPQTQLFATSGDPYVVFRVKNPDESPSITNRLEVTEIRGGQSTATLYTEDEMTGEIAMSQGNGLRRETLEKTLVGDVRTETRTVRDSTATVVFVVRQVWQEQPWGEVLTSEVLDPGGAALTNSYVYYTNAATDGPNYGNLKERRDWTGHWERYAYGSDGRIVETVTPFLDAAPGSAANLCRVTTTSFDALPDGDGDGQEELLVTHIESLLGQESGRSYEVRWSKPETVGGHTVIGVWSIRCTVAGAAWDAASNLVTKTREIRGGLLDGRVVSRVDPDQTLQLGEFVIGIDTITTTKWTGAPDATFSSVVAGRRVTTVESLTGHAVSEEEADIASGLVLSLSLVTETDALGRPTRTVFLDGTEETRTYACCGLESFTDRDGLATSYTYDALGRVRTESRAGLTTRYDYDPEGRLLSATRIGSDASEIVVEAHGFDLAGRRMWSKDAMDRETLHNETPTSGHLRRTATAPDGGTTIETIARDGSLLAVSGTAAARRNHEYGRDADGVFAKELRLTSNGEFTEWTRTCTDFAGRTYKTVTADGATTRSSFNALGQLEKTEDADNATTLFAYNTLGEQDYIVVDLDRDGVIDFDGTDRIRRTQREVVSAHGTVVERVTATEWTTDNSTATEIISVVETSADGRSIWQTAADLTAYVQTTLDAPGERTETTTLPDDTTRTRIFENDRLVSDVTAHASLGTLASVTYTYDAHARLQTATDVRTGTTTYTYYADDQIHTITTPDPDPALSGPGYDPQTTTYEYEAAGRLWRTTLPDNTVVENAYYPTGLLYRTFGSRTYPQEFSYDPQGRLIGLATWSDFAGENGLRRTFWSYDPQRGWLDSKSPLDAGEGFPYAPVTYTYWPSGRLNTRVWARGLGATYTYNNAGDLETVDYDDDTPDVTHTYDRRGRLFTTTDAAGTLTRTFTADGQLDDETYSGAGALSGQSIARSFDALNRLGSVSVPSVLSVVHTYDAASRLETVTAGNVSATYGYLANSRLIESTTMRAGQVIRLTSTRAHDKLDRLVSITSASSATPVLSHTYRHNAANLRDRITREDGTAWHFGYDTLGQVTSAQRRLADDTPISGLDFAYNFDDIGNRTSTTVNGQTSTYGVDFNDNLYLDRTIPGVIDVLGRAHPQAHVVVEQQLAARQEEWFAYQVPVDNSAGAIARDIEIVGVRNNAGPNGEDAVATVVRPVLVPSATESFSHDPDGNLTADARWTYIWDGENRLIAMETNTALVAPNGPLAESDRQRLEFTYDSQGRRIAKRVFSWNVSLETWNLERETRFLWDGWNLLAEFNVEPGTSNLSLTRTFVWGLDLSGTRQGAGGVGGLLAVNVHTPSTATYFPAADGNGNIIAAVDAATGTLSAAFDYGPFGELLLAEGPAAASIPFRFSSKFEDPETGFCYYGHRYYNPSTGRWLSRDPIGERGGMNLYAYVKGNPINAIDPLGLDAIYLLDTDNVAAAGQGHGGALIGDDKHGWTYYSFAPQIGPNSTVKDYKTLADAAKDSEITRYEKFLRFTTSRREDLRGKLKAGELFGDTYWPFSRNCGHIAGEIIKAAKPGFKVDNWRPKQVFADNLGSADSSGAIGALVPSVTPTTPGVVATTP